MRVCKTTTPKGVRLLFLLLLWLAWISINLDATASWGDVIISQVTQVTSLPPILDGLPESMPGPATGPEALHLEQYYGSSVSQPSASTDAVQDDDLVFYSTVGRGSIVGLDFVRVSEESFVNYYIYVYNTAAVEKRDLGLVFAFREQTDVATQNWFPNVEMASQKITFPAHSITRFTLAVSGRILAEAYTYRSCYLFPYLQWLLSDIYFYNNVWHSNKYAISAYPETLQ